MPKRPLETLSEAMFYVLMALRGGERCGVEIADFARQRSGGQVRIGPGTLYAILAKFLEEGLIEERAAEGRRRTYRLTEAGGELYEGELRRLRRCIADAEEGEA
ncbi:MAG: PadR family transcriptional regulator [Oscillospiraceae bacterium]